MEKRDKRGPYKKRKPLPEGHVPPVVVHRPKVVPYGWSKKHITGFGDETDVMV